MVTFDVGGKQAGILDDALWEGFRGRLRGALILPQDPTYDTERRDFNGMIDRRLAAIAQCIDTDDVAAVNFARMGCLSPCEAAVTAWQAIVLSTMA